MYSELYTLGEKVQFLKEVLVYIRSPVYVKGPKSFRYFLEQRPEQTKRGQKSVHKILKI